MKTLPPLKNRLEQLIAIASVSAAAAEWDMSNRPVIDLLANWFESLGFRVEIQNLAIGKANLIATYGQGSGGLVLSGHSDTVPFNEARWQSDPLKLSDRDGRFYGLGTADMKSFFALIIEAVLPLLEQDFKAPLIVLATADEESSMSGARALTESHIHGARAAIIGEPTGLKPIRMHKSIMMQKLEIIGQSGHSSNPALGKNALDAMSDAMISLRQFRDTMQQQYRMPEFEVAFPTLNLGCIHGGDSPNRICNACELHFDFRALPNMQPELIMQQLEQHLKPIADKHGVALNISPLMQAVDAFEQLATSELIQTVERLTHSTAEAVAFATEAPFLQNLGLETVIMGPGSIDQAHQPDEFISHQQTLASVVLLRQCIQHYCLD